MKEREEHHEVRRARTRAWLRENALGSLWSNRGRATSLFGWLCVGDAGERIPWQGDRGLNSAAPSPAAAYYATRRSRGEDDGPHPGELRLLQANAVLHSNTGVWSASAAAALLRVGEKNSSNYY